MELCASWHPATHEDKKVPSKRASGPAGAHSLSSLLPRAPGVCSAHTSGPFRRASSPHPQPSPWRAPCDPVWPPPARLSRVRGAGAVALPRDRSAAVTRTVGPEQHSVRWAVAALRLEGTPGRRRGRPAPRPFPPLQLERPSPPQPTGMGEPLQCAPARRPMTRRASPATPARGRLQLSAQLRQRPRPPRAPAAPRPRPVPGPYANPWVPQPMAGRAGPAPPRRSQ